MNITRITKLPLLILLLFTMHLTASALDSVKCIDGDIDKISLNGYSAITTIPDGHTIEDVINERVSLDWKLISSNGYHSQMGDSRYLVKADICQVQSGRYYLIIDDSKISHIKVLLKNVDTGTVEVIAESNIATKHRVGFKQHRLHICDVPFEANYNYQLYIYSHELNGSIWTDYTLFNEDEFHTYSYREELKIGCIVGIMLMFIILSVFLLIITKQTIFIYYSLYLIATSTFGIMTFGLPNLILEDINENIYDTTIWSSVFLILIMMSAMAGNVLDIRKHSTTLHAMLKFTIGYYSIVLISFIILKLLFNDTPIPFFNIMYPSIGIFPFIFLSILISYYVKTKDNTSIYLIVIFSFALISFILLGLKPLLHLDVGLFQYLRWILLLELILIFLVIVINNFNNSREEYNLINSFLQNKTSILNALVDARRSERQKISDFLHNNVGLKLGAIKMLIPSEEAKLEVLIDDLSTDIRDMSHKLNPQILNDKGLLNAIQQDLLILEDSYPDVTIKLTYKLDQTKLTLNQIEAIYHCFIEIVQNILKHGNADHIDIALSTDDDSLTLNARDNSSIAFHRSNHNGSGIKRMTLELSSIDGNLRIENLLDPKGTLHNIEIPLLVDVS